eukprot:1143416-Pelagomonas_calceolata.AAC.3
MGTRRVTSSSPCLILAMRGERSLPKSAYGASSFISALDRMSMKLQSKLGGCMGANTKLLKGLQSVREALKDSDIDCGAAAWRPQADSWAGLLHSISQAGRASVLGGADYGEGPWKQVKRLRLALSAPCSPPPPPSTSQRIPGICPWHSFHWDN